MTESTYDAGFFAPLFAIEDRHFWFRARNQVIRALAQPLVAANNSDQVQVLEVGCGTGNVLRVLEGLVGAQHVIGMDLFAEGLRYAQQRVTCPLIQADLRTPPFATRFDLVGLFDVLEHIPEDRQTLHQLRALLKPGGSLLLTVPAHMTLWSYFDEAAQHARRYSQAELREKLIEAGFEVTFLSQYMLPLFLPMWAGRRLNALRRNTTTAPEQNAYNLTAGELKVTPGINELILAALQFELPLLARHVRLPLGTSLVALARASQNH